MNWGEGEGRGGKGREGEGRGGRGGLTFDGPASVQEKKKCF